jgi:hypothetical protein
LVDLPHQFSFPAGVFPLSSFPSVKEPLLAARRLQAIVAAVALALPRLAAFLLISYACDHHQSRYHYASPPRHPGDADHAILRLEPGSEVYFPEVNLLRDHQDGLGAAIVNGSDAFNFPLDHQRRLKKRRFWSVMRRAG